MLQQLCTIPHDLRETLESVSGQTAFQKVAQHLRQVDLLFLANRIHRIAVFARCPEKYLRVQAVSLLSGIGFHLSLNVCGTHTQRNTKL